MKATFFLHAKLLFVMTAILFEPHFANGQEDEVLSTVLRRRMKEIGLPFHARTMRSDVVLGVLVGKPWAALGVFWQAD